MTETELPPEGGASSPPTRRLLTAKSVGIASAVTAGAAAVALVFATQIAVQAAAEPEAPVSTPIAADSSDADAPEKAETIAPPAVVAAAYDQLTGAEVEYVRYLGAQATDYTAGLDVFGDPGMQFLSTDVADPQGYDDGQRRLLSLYYDYATDETVSFIVNATTGSVETVARATGTQPAPTDAETALAWEILVGSDSSAAIADEFAAITGGGTLSATSPEIDLTAHSFVSDAASFGAESCGPQRCVQLLAQVDGGPFLTTSIYIVNLSTRTVLTVA